MSLCEDDVREAERACAKLLKLEAKQRAALVRNLRNLKRTLARIARASKDLDRAARAVLNARKES